MNPNNLYGNAPSIVAGIIFVILFFGTTFFHAIQLIKARCWYFIPFVVGGAFQVIGYICRALAHNNLASVPIYAMQSLFILLAPPLYAASIYMVLGRTVTHLNGEKLSLVRVRWMTKLFVSGDVLSFLMQSGGGGLLASDSASMRQTGSNVVIGGLVVQLVFFGFFVVVAAVFHYRIKRDPTSESEKDRVSTMAKGWRRRTWETVLHALYVVSILILVRSVFRLVEYKGGYDGYIMTHEVYGYIFDALLMFIAMVVMNMCHPAVILGDGKRKDVPISESGDNVQL